MKHGMEIQLSNLEADAVKTEVVQLSREQLELVDGAGWFGDVFDWVDENVGGALDWVVEMVEEKWGDYVPEDMEEFGIKSSEKEDPYTYTTAAYSGSGF